MMDQGVQHMVDGKTATGAMMTGAGSISAWLDVAEPIVTITMTVVVGAVTVWYSVERALKLRRERKSKGDK